MCFRILATKLCRLYEYWQDGEKSSGFLNEAKEWAGELLSGQTKVKHCFHNTLFRLELLI